MINFAVLSLSCSAPTVRHSLSDDLAVKKPRDKLLWHGMLDGILAISLQQADIDLR